MKQSGALTLRGALCERGWQNTQDLDESQISENMRWGESGSKGLTITIALAEKIYFLQQDFECGVYLPTSSPRPAFVADKKLFAWLWEEPSHILSFSPAPPRNDDDSHPFLPLGGSFSIFAAVQPFLPLLDTSFPFLLLQASPTHAFSTQPLFICLRLIVQNRGKKRATRSGEINKSKQKRRGGSEGKQRGWGEVSLTSGFLSAVSASRSRGGDTCTLTRRGREYMGFFPCLLKMNQWIHCEMHIVR